MASLLPLAFCQSWRLLCLSLQIPHRDVGFARILCQHLARLKKAGPAAIGLEAFCRALQTFVEVRT
jgi:hypothetical protein